MLSQKAYNHICSFFLTIFHKDFLCILKNLFYNMKFLLVIFNLFLLFANVAFGQSCQDFSDEFLKQAKSASVSNQYRSYLAKSLDLQNATKFSLGANWKALTPEQRKQFYDVYSKYVVYKYASQMDRYKIMDYKITSTASDEKRPAICNASIVIKTTINNKVVEVPLKSVISVKDENKPLLQDLAFENISVLQLQRDEVESLLKSKGFDGMLKVFEDFVKNNK